MRRRLASLALAALAAATFPAAFADSNKACALATPAELEGLLGEAVPVTPQGAMEGGSICGGANSKATVILRVARARGSSADAAKAGADIARKSGAQVDIQTFGPMTCSTTIPPDNLAGYGFNTTCSLTKDKSVAAIEVTSKKKADMVPIDKLKPVAEKMSSRF